MSEATECLSAVERFLPPGVDKCKKFYRRICNIVKIVKHNSKDFCVAVFWGFVRF